MADNISSFKLLKVKKSEISILEGSYTPSRPKKEGRFLEPIVSYPKNYKVLGTYQEDLQNSYRSSKYFLSSEERMNEYAENFGEDYLEYLKKFSEIDTFDCVLSACEVENDSGIKSFVFDVNNDEDFSNDKIVEYTSSVLNISGDKTVNLEVATSEISIQMFNGESIIDTTFGFDFIKREENGRIGTYFEPVYFPSGYVKLSDKKYFISLINLTPDIEFKPHDFIWIDLNDNRILESNSDYYQQMMIPFTIDGVSYKISGVNPYGNEISIMEQDPAKYPPISAGLPAPDFQFVASDSFLTLLENKEGNYLLLDFWYCNSDHCSTKSLDIYSRYKGKFSLIVIPFVEASFEFLKEEQRIQLGNISKVVSGQDIKKMRNLFQIGAEPTYILIGPDNEILFKEKAAYDKIYRLLSDNLEEE